MWKIKEKIAQRQICMVPSLVSNWVLPLCSAHQQHDYPVCVSKYVAVRERNNINTYTTTWLNIGGSWLKKEEIRICRKTKIWETERNIEWSTGFMMRRFAIHTHTHVSICDIYVGSPYVDTRRALACMHDACLCTATTTYTTNTYIKHTCTVHTHTLAHWI